MYYTQCDWCGEIVDTKLAYVKACIEVVTTGRDRLGKRETVTEPTRFFHAHDLRSADEWDRLGIEVKDGGLGDCCYTRALRVIEGEPSWETPDLGMEWRLMPVDPDEAPDGVPRAIREERLWIYENLSPDKTWKRPRPQLIEAGLKVGLWKLRETDIETVGGLIDAVKNQSLLKVHGIGPKRLALIEQDLARFVAGWTDQRAAVEGVA